MHQTNGTTDDVLVCIPLPGRNRYRMSMLAPDATGLTRDAVTGPLRQFSLLGGREHTTLLYGGENCGPADVEMFERAADKAITTARGHMDVYLIAAPSAGVAATVLPVVRDSHGEFAKAYSASEPSVFIVRPDGYLGFAAPGVHVDDLVTHQRAIFG
jgi:pentachlorophenol monooxygenase